MDEKIWADSGDSHLSEPTDLFTKNLPAGMADRMPRSVKDDDGIHETIYVDGQTFRRRMPRMGATARQAPETIEALRNKPKDVPPESFAEVLTRAPGCERPQAAAAGPRRRRHLGRGDLPVTRHLVVLDPRPAPVARGREGDQRLGDRVPAHFAAVRCAASVPLLDIDDTVAEMHRAAELGFKVAFFTTRPPFGAEPYHHDAWMPVWAAAAEAGTVVGFHIGTEPHTPEEQTGVYSAARVVRCSIMWRPPTAANAASPSSSRAAPSTAIPS